MKMELIVLRKLVAGILALLIGMGVIKWQPIQDHIWLRVLVVSVGSALIIFAALYQFEIISPDSHDALLR